MSGDRGIQAAAKALESAEQAFERAEADYFSGATNEQPLREACKRREDARRALQAAHVAARQHERTVDTAALAAERR